MPVRGLCGHGKGSYGYGLAHTLPVPALCGHGKGDYFMAVILFTGEESNSTVCKSSARVPHLHQHLTGWLRSVILALTNLTASHFLPGERPSFLVIKTSFFLLLFFLSQTFFFIIPLNEVITEDHISSNTISA